MAKGQQASSGQAVYRLNFVLRTPGVPAEGTKPNQPVKWARKPMWLPAGSEVTSGQLEGLQIPALEYGKYIVQIKEPEVACEFCQAHGTQAQKKERYASAAAMREHYQDAHPGVRSTEQF